MKIKEKTTTYGKLARDGQRLGYTFMPVKEGKPVRKSTKSGN